jgi:5-methylcytosine-specific restriction endonuclease McrA
MPHSDPVVRATYFKTYRAKHRERLAAQNRAYRASIPDLATKKHEEYLRNMAAYKARAKASREQMPYWRLKLQRANKKARAKGAVIDNLASIEAYFKQVYSQPSAVCDYCQQAFLIKQIVIDHKHPYARGGRHAVSNFAISCFGCNNRKLATPYDKWLQKLEGGLN